MKIREILEKLSKKTNYRGVFHSEADFQFQFGWALKEEYNDIDIIFEKPYINRGRRNERIDIVVIKDGKQIPIELKYFTSQIDLDDRFDYLKNQNDSWRVYDVLHDVERNEDFISREENNSEVGYTILITNNKFYWNGPRQINDSTKYGNFLFNEGKRTIFGNIEIEWRDVEGGNDWRTRQGIRLNQDYDILWNDYLKITSDNGENVKNGEFKYIVFETRKI